MRPTLDSERDDDALLCAYVEGDTSAFEVLFQRHRKPLFTYLVHRTGSAELAEDLFQEAFLRLIRSCGAYRPSGSFRAWLFTIAHNALTDARRRASLHSSPGASAMRETKEAVPEEGWEEALASRTSADDPVARSQAGDLGRQLEAALARLPDAQREVFLLRERAGLDLKGIAEITGASLATVKSRMRYALAGLRRLLSDQLVLPESSHE